MLLLLVCHADIYLCMYNYVMHASLQIYGYVCTIMSCMLACRYMAICVYNYVMYASMQIYGYMYVQLKSYNILATKIKMAHRLMGAAMVTIVESDCSPRTYAV